MLSVIRTDRYLVSTDGTSRSRHPDPVAISRIITRRGTTASLQFNYDTDTTRPWDNPRLKDRYEYTTVYPDDSESWLRVTL